MAFAFDRYVLDGVRAELRCDGVVVPVEPQVFDLLELLVSSHGRVVSRDEIFERIWGNRIVSDAALSSRIRDARRAIGDDGAAQRLIRTVHRRGLRFVGDVREAEEDTRPQTPFVPVLRTEPDFERPAIIVLPFRETSEPGASPLAEELTGAVTAALNAWRIFPVVSRTTAARYADADSATLAAETGARYAITGTVRATEDQFRVQVELTDTEADRLLWSERVTRERADLRDAEEELAAQIATMAMPELEGAEARRALRKPKDEMTSWEMAMRAAQLIHAGGAAGFAEAERLAIAAADLKPDWALPHSLIAVARFQQAMRGFSASDSRTAFADTLDAGRRALEIDDRAWIAHALSGVGELWTNQNHERAILHVNRAIDLNPSASMNYHFGGCVAGFSGDLETAQRHQKRLFRMDPIYPYTAVIEADLGLWHLLGAEHDAAEERLVRAHRWDPRYGRALQRMIALYGLRGEPERARQAARKLSDLGLPMNLDVIAASYPFRRDADRTLFIEGLKHSGVGL